MKTTKHFVLGLLASLLFAAGFAKAADRLDLTVQGISPVHNSTSLVVASDCALPCISGGGGNN